MPAVHKVCGAVISLRMGQCLNGGSGGVTSTAHDWSDAVRDSESGSPRRVAQRLVRSGLETGVKVA